MFRFWTLFSTGSSGEPWSRGALSQIPPLWPWRPCHCWGLEGHHQGEVRSAFYEPVWCPTKHETEFAKANILPKIAPPGTTSPSSDTEGSTCWWTTRGSPSSKLPQSLSEFKPRSSQHNTVAKPLFSSHFPTTACHTKQLWEATSKFSILSKNSSFY